MCKEFLLKHSQHSGELKQGFVFLCIIDRSVLDGRTKFLHQLLKLLWIGSNSWILVLFFFYVLKNLQLPSLIWLILF